MINNIFIYIVLIIFAVLFVAWLLNCNEESEDILVDKFKDKSVVMVGMNTVHISQVSLRNAYLYWFDETDKLYKRNYYHTMEALALDRITLVEGSYTVMAVLNVGADFEMPVDGLSTPNVNLATCSNYVKSQESNNSDMLTGVLRHQFKNGIQMVSIDLEDKLGGIKDVNVELLLTIPSSNLPSFVSTSAVTAQLRATAYIFKKGETSFFITKRAMLQESETAGVYNLNMALFPGDYNVNLWMDYTMDVTTNNHYIASHKQGDVMRILDKACYCANDDSRDAFSKRISISVKEESNTKESVQMNRPLAKYRLIATDLEEYNQLRVKKNLPEIKDLRVFIGYEGSLPTAYSMTEQKVANTEQGYHYNTIMGIPTTTDVEVAKDFIFVDDSNSSVCVKILFKDGEGNTISGVNSVKIAFRSGHLTTVSGNFLTSRLGSRIMIKTEWDDDINIEF